MKWRVNLYLILSRFVFTCLVLVLNSCKDSGYITPSTQAINSKLNSLAAEEYPSFSYGGRYLVFSSDRNSKRSVFLYDLRSRRLLKLPGLNQPGSMQYQADISADGRYIVYTSEQLGKTDIYLYDRQKYKSRNITKNLLGEVRRPSVSGDGRFISFESNRSGQWDIEVFDLGLGVDISLPQNLAPKAE